MSKKKGLSLEEKRSRLLDLFYEKKELFQLKELEKLAPKEKGIVSQSVKDVLQSLVDDNMVDTDKIGTMVCYWAFPSKALNIRTNRLDDIGTQLNAANDKKAAAEQMIAELSEGKEDSEEREALLERVKSLEAEVNKARQEIDKLAEFDPEILDKKDKEAKLAKEAANRWTDNVLAVKQWCKNKFSMEEAALDKQFGIPEDFDYIE